MNHIMNVVRPHGTLSDKIKQMILTQRRLTDSLLLIEPACYFCNSLVGNRMTKQHLNVNCFKIHGNGKLCFFKGYTNNTPEASPRKRRKQLL